MKKIPIILLALCLAFSLSACVQSAGAQSEQSAAAVPAGGGDDAEGRQESGGSARSTRIKAVRGLTFEVETADPQDMSPAFNTGSISVSAKLFQKDGGGWDGQLNITRKKDEVGGVKQMHRLVILAEKSGQSYKGTLFYSIAEEKTVTPGVYAKGQTSGQINEDVELAFAPFEYGAYRENGGHMPEWQTARLSHMATAVCGGQTVLFTAAGTEVYAELPDTGFDGWLRGELTDLTPEIKSIAGESFALYKAESLYLVY